MTIYIGDQGIVKGTGISISEDAGTVDPDKQPRISLSKATFNTFNYLDEGIATTVQPSIVGGESVTTLTVGSGNHDIVVNAEGKKFTVQSNNFSIDEDGNVDVAGEVNLGEAAGDYVEIDDLTTTPDKTWSSQKISDADAQRIPIAQKAAPGGVATLDGSGRIPTNQLPDLALTDVTVVADETAQLELVVQEGDVAKREDTGATYMARNTDNASMADWVEITAAGEVISVAGRIGAVVLSPADVGLENVTNDPQLTIANNLSDLSDIVIARNNLGLADTTDANNSGASYIGVFDDFDNSSASDVQTILTDLDTAISGKAPLIHNHVDFTGDSGAGGTAGYVPAPIAGDADKFLNGGGDFQNALTPSNNLSDVADPEVARTNLELGDAAQLDVGTDPENVAAGDHSHNDVTVSLPGFMAAIDKIKLNSIADNANLYVHPDNNGNKHLPVNGAAGNFVKWLDTGEGYWSDLTVSDIADIGTAAGKNVGTGANDVAAGIHDHVVATDTVAGYMSAPDKIKLDGIAGDIEEYVHPTTNGNLHLPVNGVEGNFVRWSALGTGVWDNITISDIATGLGDAAPLNVGTGAGDVSPAIHDHAEVTPSDPGYMSTADKDKLDAIEDGANTYVHPSDDGNMHIPSGGGTNNFVRWSAGGTGSWSTLSNSDVNGLGTAATLDVGVGVAAQVHVHDPVTTSVDGYMSAADKTKLDGIEAGAGVYVHPTTTGNVHVPTGGATGNFVKWASDGTGSWSGITNADVTGFGTAADSAVEDFAAAVHSHTNATTSVDGYMSAADKTKIDTIDAFAGNYTHPSDDGNMHIPTGGTSGNFVKWSADGTGSWSGITNADVTGFGTAADLNIEDFSIVAHSHTNATTSVSGYLSDIDKTKLDGITAGANNYIHPTDSGNVHLPTGGATDQILVWSSDGVAAWTDPTTYNQVITPIVHGDKVDLSIGNDHAFSAMGSTSLDPDATTVTYNWTATHGTLSAATGASITLTFAAGNVGVTGTLSCQATDDQTNSSITTDVIFTVLDAVVPSGLVLSLPTDYEVNTIDSLDITVGDDGGDAALLYEWQTSLDGGIVWGAVGLSDQFIKNPDIMFTETNDNLMKIRCKVTNKAGTVIEISGLYSVLTVDDDFDSQYLDNAVYSLANEMYSSTYINSTTVQVPLGTPFEVGDYISLNGTIDVVASISGAGPQDVTITNNTIAPGEVSEVYRLNDQIVIPTIEQESSPAQFDFVEAEVEVQWARNTFAVTESSGDVVINHGSNDIKPFYNGDSVLVSNGSDHVSTTISSDPVHSGTDPYYTTISVTAALPSNPTTIELIPIADIQADLHSGTAGLQSISETVSVVNSMVNKATATLTGNQGNFAEVELDINANDLAGAKISRIQVDFKSIQV